MFNPTRIASACAAALLFTTLSASAATEQAKSSSAVLMQGYHWNSATGSWYNTVNSRVSDIKTLGVTHVWLPPASDAADANGYLPRQLNKLDSRYGTAAQLKTLNTNLKNNGIHPVADIVVNHRVGTSNWADFTNPTWGSWAVTRDDEWGQGTGAWDTGTGYNAARDLDHTNATVRNDIKYFMNTTLKNAGFTGWRYDFSKGYSASYAKEYHDATNPSFCVGEIWTDLNYNDVNGHRQQLMNYVDGTAGACAAFDFTTKGLLNRAISNNEYWRLRDSQGKPAGGIGWWAQKMVTFVDNHDTGPSGSCGSGQNLWPVPCGGVVQSYAYILTHPGIPTVYWTHVYDWNLRNEIKAMIDIRKRQGITSTSSVAIQVAENGRYAAIVNGKVAVKIGPNDWSPGAGWKLSAYGYQYAIWEKI